AGGSLPDLPRIVRAQAVNMTPSVSLDSRRLGRLCIIVAAILWSLNGLFVPLLTKPTAFGLDQPIVDPWHIAFYRVFFAGVVLLPSLRRSHLTFRKPMLFAAGSFAVMNALFVLAMTWGEVATALI